MWALLAAFVIGLLRHGESFEPLVDGWLGSITTLLPALVLLGASRHRPGVESRELLLLGLGTLTWSAGGVYFVTATAQQASLPFPSWGDLGFLSFPLLVFVALAVRVRRSLAGVQTTVWLDSAVGGLGAVAVLAVPLGPVLAQATDGDPWAVAVAVAYPLTDLLLAAIVVGVVVAYGLRPPQAWLWLLVGLLVYAAADMVYALRVSLDSYHLGTPLDALWSLGLTLVATGALLAPHHERRIARPDSRLGLAVPAMATVGAVAVLVAGRWVPVPALAIVLATATLLCAAVRTQLAFYQVVRLYDLGRQARTDSLTGLGNRRALHEHLATLLATSPVTPLAVLLIDLDHFKEINDTLGHHVGDELLALLGPRFSAELDEKDLLVRLGGDEFAVVLGRATGSSSELVAQRLLDLLVEPFTLDGVPLRVSASVGIALCPEDCDDANGLLQRADVAMYAAKAVGGTVRRYDPSHDQHSRARLRTVEELRTALDQDELTVHYQPQCDVLSGSVLGLEALVRWEHPRRGLLGPDQFLFLVEQTGLMPALTTYVLREAVRQCRQWRLDGLDVGVSVNLSASSLLDQDLPEQVACLLTSNDLSASALTLELTENTLMLDPARCRTTLLRLKELGVAVSIDDYGTGYCSLSYLRDLPVDELKLDRTFVCDLTGSTRNAAIVRSTVDLAHALGLRLVAEGVEDEETLVLLQGFACDVAQGYHLSRPLPADAITAWLRERPHARYAGAWWAPRAR